MLLQKNDSILYFWLKYMCKPGIKCEPDFPHLCAKRKQNVEVITVRWRCDNSAKVMFNDYWFHPLAQQDLQPALSSDHHHTWDDTKSSPGEQAGHFLSAREAFWEVNIAYATFLSSFPVFFPLFTRLLHQVKTKTSISHFLYLSFLLSKQCRSRAD